MAVGIDAEIVTGWPGRIRFSCVSLKLASIKTSSSGTTLPSRLPDHDEIAGVDQTVGESAVDRRAHRSEVEVALGLGERSLQFSKLGASLRLLRLGHLDIVARRVIGRLRGLHSSQTLVASGLGLFEGRVRGKTLVAQRLLPVVVEVARFKPASAEASCALDCSTALSCALIWRPIRSMVACWVSILVRAASTAMR